MDKLCSRIRGRLCLSAMDSEAHGFLSADNSGINHRAGNVPVVWPTVKTLM